jgi:hypothetical protein
MLTIACSLATSAQVEEQDEEEYESDTLTKPAVAIKTTTSPFLQVTEATKVPVRKVPAAKLNSIKKEDAYWYANREPEKKKEEARTEASGNNLFDQDWFRTLLWIVILVSFTAVVIWYLASGNIRLFRKKAEEILDDEEEEIREDIFALNYEREISKAVEVKNFRLAVRLLYLRTLKELSERNIIDYGHEKTNSHYLNGLFGSPYYHSFFRLTRNFEYTWYGGFLLSEEGYQMMQSDFSNFKSGLR